VTIEVRRVDVEVVRPLRHEVLRPGEDLAESFYPADDLSETVHVAALDGEVVVGTATVFPEPHDGRSAWRLRGMAVEESHRGSGVGSMVLTEVLRQVREHDVDLLWCNARTVALPFYTGHGFTIVGDEFLTAHGVPHYLAIFTMVADQA
jgi:predicted GNAT family N-acyltransferase